MSNPEYNHAPGAPPVPFDAMLGPVLAGFATEKMAPIDATPTPFPAWNAKCRGAGGGKGIARGWHIVVGARSGNGKSILGACMGAAAVKAGERVAILSLEMAQSEMATRILSIVSGEPIRDLEHGEDFQPEAWSRASRRMQEVHEETGGILYVNRTPIGGLSDVHTSIRHLHEHRGVRFFVVDYLQLAAMVGRSSDLLDKVTEVSHVVRGLAKEYRVTTVGMSQLNRETSKAQETPHKEGLMGGSPLENDADQVLLLDHSRIGRDAKTGGILSFAVLDKNRHGPGGEIPTHLSTRTLSMTEVDDDHMDERRLRVA